MLLIHSEGRDVSRGRDGGVAKVVCTPLGWWCVQGACSIPWFSPKFLFLLQALHKWQLGCFFCFLVSMYLCLELAPTAHAQNYFWGPCSLFAFCCWRRHVSMCKHCSKGSQNPDCIIIRRDVTNKEAQQPKGNKERGRTEGREPASISTSESPRLTSSGALAELEGEGKRKESEMNG